MTETRLGGHLERDNGKKTAPGLGYVRRWRPWLLERDHRRNHPGTNPLGFREHLGAPDVPETLEKGKSSSYFHVKGPRDHRCRVGSG